MSSYKHRPIYNGSPSIVLLIVIAPDGIVSFVTNSQTKLPDRKTSKSVLGISSAAEEINAIFLSEITLAYENQAFERIPVLDHFHGMYAQHKLYSHRNLGSNC